MQLVIGVAAMVMIANYQYGWTFFVPDIQKTFGWDRASIQWAFTLFVLFETWLVPVEGWFVDKYGPRIVVQPSTGTSQVSNRTKSVNAHWIDARSQPNFF